MQCIGRLGWYVLVSQSSFSRTGCEIAFETQTCQWPILYGGLKIVTLSGSSNTKHKVVAALPLRVLLSGFSTQYAAQVLVQAFISFGTLPWFRPIASFDFDSEGLRGVLQLVRLNNSAGTGHLLAWAPFAVPVPTCQHHICGSSFGGILQMA